MSVNKQVCQICGAKEKLEFCLYCQLVAYCSQDHRLKDWESHKLVCKSGLVECVQKLSIGKVAKNEGKI